MTFDWLNKIVKARTPGPYKCGRLDAGDGRQVGNSAKGVHLDYIRVSTPVVAGTAGSRYITKKQRDADAVFIATMGTLGDRVMDVVNAAESFRVHGEAKNGTHAAILFKALSALQESQDRLKEGGK